MSLVKMKIPAGYYVLCRNRGFIFIQDIFVKQNASYLTAVNDNDKISKKIKRFRTYLLTHVITWSNVWRSASLQMIVRRQWPFVKFHVPRLRHNHLSPSAQIRINMCYKPVNNEQAAIVVTMYKQTQCWQCFFEIGIFFALKDIDFPAI